MGRTTISAVDFWDHYFRDKLIRLERHADRYDGIIADNQGGPLAFLTGSKTTDITVSTSALQAYDYASDPRFTLITKIPREIADAYSVVEDRTYPYRDPAPFGPKRMAELFEEVRSAYRLSQDKDITLPTINSVLAELVSSYTPSIVQPIAALAWFLGERRDVTSADVLISVIADSGYVGGIIHFTVVDAAFDALWKVNAKLHLPRLIQWMQRANDTGRRNIGALLSRLLSMDVMLSPDLLGEDYSQPHYWNTVITRANANTQAAWDRYDMNALYWEIRYLAARRLPAEDVANRAKLAQDVVRPVADAARGYG